MHPEPRSTLPPGIHPAPRIEQGDLLIRRWQRRDLFPRWAAITASYDLLRPWWGDSLVELATLEGQRRYAAKCELWPSTDGGYRYGIFDRDGALLGGINLHDRIGDGAIELGYWCHTAHTGRGVITRAAAALTDLARTLPGITRVEIRCDVANIRSAAVPRRLGFHLDRLGPRPRAAPADTGTQMYWIKQR
ncbi:GNAT family N-acetyltransferase [Nocardia pseudobrasiliensis]|uniref:RimJ/RimL family protein N-acetyltransferase n=1 Tax=Nocardia pseudobrasiliensis TaxID=45979 RepID=A0A370HYM6_9NOCA|nr:GNAT family N-acetyltransferase [Nocardia pseudobrasiliensis]RDI63578.1 RimJ/RimL family protein N-acetyltransferase [Nocardia pseudobrasiliensis]